MNYQDLIKAHMASYRANALGISEQGFWRKHPYPHILPKVQQELNILETLRPTFADFRKANTEIKLHEGFHHLNSSQAMAFNLFLPLFSNSAALNAVFPGNPKSDQIIFSEMEHVFPEDGTNVDAYFVRRSAARLLIEVKFTESGFGSAKPDDRRKEKLEALYKPRLRSVVSSECLTPELFFANYQLMRNLFHLREGTDDRLLLLFPKGNAALEHCEHFFERHITPALWNRVMPMHLEDCVTRIIEAFREDPVWRRHFESFRSKYLP